MAVRRASVSGMVVAALALAAQDGLASPNARLVYSRSPDAAVCPDEARLRAAVAARVGYDPFFPHAPRTVIVSMAAASGRLISRVELVDADARSGGARELIAAESGCEDLFESTALAIAIAIDPHALVGPSPPTDPEPLTRSLPPDVEPEVPLREAPPAPPSPPRPEGPRFRGSLALRGTAGVQPDIAPGAFVGGALVGRRASIGLELGSYLPTATSTVGGEAQGWLVAGGVVPCLRMALLDLCGVFSAGRFEGAGNGFAQSFREGAPFFALGGRAGVEVGLDPRFHLHLDAEVLGNLARTAMQVGPEEVWKAGAAIVGLSAGVSYELVRGGSPMPATARARTRHFE